MMIQGQVFMALPRVSDACALSHYPGDFGICISRCINLMLADSCWAWLNDRLALTREPNKGHGSCQVKLFS